MKDVYKKLIPVVARFVIYAGLIALITVGLMHLPKESFYEDRAVEWTQFSFLMLCSACFIFSAFRNREHKALSLLFAGLMLIAAIRECDRTLDYAVAKGFWKVGVAFVVIPLSIFACREKNSIVKSTLEFIHGRGFGIIFSGFSVLVFSRLFGHNEFWIGFIGETNQRLILRIIEEGTEMLAYFIFLTGSIEYAITIHNLKESVKSKKVSS